METVLERTVGKIVGNNPYSDTRVKQTGLEVCPQSTNQRKGKPQKHPKYGAHKEEFIEPGSKSTRKVRGAPQWLDHHASYANPNLAL